MRELTPGVFWLGGGCQEYEFNGVMLHSYNSSFLVAGSDCSLLVDTGWPSLVPILIEQLEMVLDGGIPPLRYLFVTHWEPPHAGGTALLLERFPDLMFVGDPTDFHLVFPEYEDRVRPAPVGTRIELGGTDFEVLPAVLRDAASTRWGFEPRRRALFPADGFAYTHLHSADQCGLTAEEVSALDIAEMTAMFADAAYYWSRFVEVEPYIVALDQMLETFDVKLIFPAHGLPIANCELIMPLIRKGLRYGSGRGRR